MTLPVYLLNRLAKAAKAKRGHEAAHGDVWGIILRWCAVLKSLLSPCSVKVDAEPSSTFQQAAIEVHDQD